MLGELTQTLENEAGPPHHTLMWCIADQLLAFFSPPTSAIATRSMPIDTLTSHPNLLHHRSFSLAPRRLLLPIAEPHRRANDPPGSAYEDSIRLP